jgi:hypothetical protein
MSFAEEDGVKNYSYKQRFDSIYIGFADKQNIWGDMLAEGFAHCFVMMKTKENDWFVMDPTVEGLFPRIVRVKGDANYAEFVQRLNKIPILKVKLPPRKKLMGIKPLLGVCTCVHFAKYMIGIKAAWCLTPKALYERLLAKHGAEIIRGIK